MSYADPRARNTDPSTSHRAAAAAAVTAPTHRQMVEAYARTQPDGFTDVDLALALPGIQENSLRTRRNELTERNIILDSKLETIPAGHTQKHTVWKHRDFVALPPPIIAAPTKLSPKARKEAGERHAASLERSAKQMRGEGRAIFADALEDAARFIRTLI